VDAARPAEAGHEIAKPRQTTRRAVLQRNRAIVADYVRGDLCDPLGRKRFGAGDAAGEGDDVRIVDQFRKGPDRRRTKVPRITRQKSLHQRSSVMETKQASRHEPTAALTMPCAMPMTMRAGANISATVGIRFREMFIGIEK